MIEQRRHVIAEAVKTAALPIYVGVPVSLLVQRDELDVVPQKVRPESVGK